MKWAFLASFFTVIHEPDFLSPLPDPEPMLSYSASLFFLQTYLFIIYVALPHLGISMWALLVVAYRI